MKNPLLEVMDIHFAYDEGAEVLSGASLTVGRGSCMCLMGANGCGKSTVIDCILGERIPVSGTVQFDGTPLEGVSQRDRARLMSFVPQAHTATFPYRVDQVVRMGRSAHAGFFAAPTRSEDDAAVAQALTLCGIEHLAERPYTMLSGGETQMVMLARALAQDAPLVIMDEPTAHLDFRNELLFLETIERLVKEKGATVLMATHAPNHAFHLVASGVPTSVALMCAGRIVAQGEPSEVLTAQSLHDVFGVRGFIASCAVPQVGHCGQAGSMSKEDADAIVLQVVPLRTLNEQLLDSSSPTKGLS